MGKRGLVFALAIIAAALALFAGCSQPGEQTTADGNDDLASVVVGVDMYPPYVSTGESGELVGIDVDILTEAFGRIGYKPTFQVIDWERKNDLLSAGEIDCIASCYTMTGREGEYRWAGPYLKSRQVVAVDPTSDIYTLADLEDKVVAVQSTTKPEGIILDRTNPKVPKVKNVFTFTSSAYLNPALVKGYVDAIAAHETSILTYEEDYGVEYRILDESLLDVGLGIAFDKNDERGIAEALDGALSDMLSDGTMADILGRYFDDVSPFLDMEGLDG